MISEWSSVVEMELVTLPTHLLSSPSVFVFVLFCFALFCFLFLFFLYGVVQSLVFGIMLTKTMCPMLYLHMY